MQSPTESMGCRGTKTSGNRRIVACSKGQSTVEWAIVMAALIAVVIGLGCLWRLGDSGAFVQHALLSAPNHVSASAGAWCDALAC